MDNNTYRYGWIPDRPDHRDSFYTAPKEHLLALPSSVNLRNQFPPVYDQGNLGSCTANGIGAIFQFERKKLGLTPDFMPSRLFIYYNERVMEGTVNSDNGAYIRDGMKSVEKQGVCSETDWPYDISKFAKRPEDKFYNIAQHYRVVNYYRIESGYQQDPNKMLDNMKACLASGHPFVFGFTVYESFMTEAVARTGVVPMPSRYNDSPTGGHCVVAVGYDDAQQRFIIRNSWGEGWGDRGHCTMPYAYLSNNNLSDDFWTIRLISHLNATE